MGLNSARRTWLAGMKANEWVALAAVALAGASGLSAQNPGVRPRSDAQAYAASALIPHAKLGVTALSVKEVRARFATDLSKDYLVFEVAFYPQGEIKISPTDFVLKGLPKTAEVLPAEPAVVARNIEEKNRPKQASGRKVDVVPVVDVGYESGPGYDTNGNYGRRSGWHTAVGVGVGIGGPNSGYPAGPGADGDRGAMEAELFDKSLPEGPITQATAGYLYFPIGKNRAKAATYELDYAGPAGAVKLTVPVPHEK